MKLVNLLPLGEININDPALVKARAAKNQMDKIKHNPRIGFDQALDLRDEKKDLELRISNLYREMESDPDVEAEGGPVADQYGDELNRLETRLYKINKEIASYDMSEGTTLNETTEKAWNAIDVSRKAEKEISNREWNERTTKKLDMLKALNAAGKFKKDFDEERLQGWVDQNYSWEKLSRQFKTNEDIIREAIKKEIKENFDNRLKAKMGMSNDEFEDQIASRDIGSPFPGNNNVSPFTAKAKDYIEKFRQEYKDMSDEGIDKFSVEIIDHLLDNTAAQARAKVYFAKNSI